MARNILTACAVAALLASGCDGFRNEVEQSQCRANLNTLSTDQALFRTTYGRWAPGMEELDAVAGRSRTLVCPTCEEEYVLVVDDGGYTLSCPDGTHGSIATGRASWAGEQEQRAGG